MNKVVNSRVPCYKCEGRYYNCHTYCEKYLHYAKVNKMISKVKSDEHQVQFDYLQVTNHNKKRGGRI
ncbi:MAG: hypothetical protein R3Y64_10705 [Peptostreptococcaceae bacterium]